MSKTLGVKNYEFGSDTVLPFRPYYSILTFHNSLMKVVKKKKAWELL